MRFAMGNGLLILGLAWASGCVAEVGNPEPEEGIVMSLVISQTHFETMIVTQTAIEYESIIAPIVIPEPDNDPCQCTETSCQEAWLESNLGCNVCIVLRCENQDPAHVCVSCPE